MQLAIHRVKEVNISQRANEGVTWLEIDIHSDDPGRFQVILFLSPNGTIVHSGQQSFPVVSSPPLDLRQPVQPTEPTTDA